MGSLLAAVRLSGVTPCGRFSIETSKKARRLVRHHWPEVITYPGIAEVNLEETRHCRSWFPGARRVLHAAGFPCQGLSSLSAAKLGMMDPRSKLLQEALRITAELRAVTDWEALGLYANLQSRGAAGRKTVTDLIETVSFPFDAAEIGACRRERPYWIDGPKPADGGDFRIGTRRGITAAEPHIPGLAWCLDHCCVAFSPGSLPFPTFVRPTPPEGLTADPCPFPPG